LERLLPPGSACVWGCLSSPAEEGDGGGVAGAGGLVLQVEEDCRIEALGHYRSNKQLVGERLTE
jgi:hypothetical protein